MPTLIHKRVALANAGDNPYVITKLKSGWVVIGDVQPLDGYCLLLADPVVTDLNSLNEMERAQYCLDMIRVGDALLKVTGAYRINYETWGNGEAALHTHIMPRYLHEPDDKRTSPACTQYDWRKARQFDSIRDRPFVDKMRSELQTVGNTLCEIRIERGHRTVPADIVVVIDVIRAFTVSHLALRQGAREILLCETTDEARALKRQYPDSKLMGEEYGVRPEGFDFGNSPTEISRQNLKECLLIHRTSNGTQAAIAAKHSRRVVVTGFSNAQATARWVRHKIKEGGVRSIVLLATDHSSDDDFACAEYLLDLIECRLSVIPSEVAKRIRESLAADRIRKTATLDCTDLDYCASELGSSFVMRVDYGDRPKICREVL